MLSTSFYLAREAFRDQAYAEEQYLLAEPWLNIVSQDPEKVPARDYRKLQQSYERDLSLLKKRLEEMEDLLNRPHWRAFVKEEDKEP